MRGHKNAWLKNAGALLLTIVFLSPVIWLIVSSFKTDAEIFRTPPTFWPEAPTIQAYLDLLNSDLVLHFRNSLMIAVSSMLIAMTLSIPAAYGLARFQNRFRRQIILFFLITQMLPSSLLLTPLFLMFSGAGLINRLAAPIFSTVTLSIPFVVILLRPFFTSLPKTIEEAARVDGCNTLGAFFRIMLPVAKTGICTAGVFCFIFPWNDLAYSMTFVRNQNLWPLTVIINDFQTKYGIKWNSILAFGVCLVIPILILFVLMQKYIVDGLTAGAVKG